MFHTGHSIAQIRLIMQPIGKNGMLWAWKDRFIAYVQCFDISSERDPTTQLHILKRAKCSNGIRMGDVFPVSQLRVPVNLIPRFSTAADTRLTPYNSMEHATEFWLNYFWDKNTFLCYHHSILALSSYLMSSILVCLKITPKSYYCSHQW